MPRRKNDAYYTPQFLVEKLLEMYDLRLHDHCIILEPCVGNGAIANVLMAYINYHEDGELITNDIDKSVDASGHQDAIELLKDLNDDYENHPDWIITNPPFNLAHQIVPLAYNCAKQGIIMLLRLSWLEPCRNRCDFLKAHPPTKLIVCPRVSFTGDGKSDSCTCAWFIWDKRHSALINNPPIDFIV